MIKILERIRKALRPVHVEPIRDCMEESICSLAQGHKETRERIDRMIEQATMNGEERWFLTIHKETKHGHT
jgi:hypothetical protein